MKSIVSVLQTPALFPATALQNHSRASKNVRFRMVPSNKYNICSKALPWAPLARVYTRRVGMRRFPALTNQVLAQHMASSANPIWYHKNTKGTLAWQAHQTFKLQAHHIYRSYGRKETLDTVLKGSDQDIWRESLSNEWGRLAQGNNAGVCSTDTIDFIHCKEVPVGRDITYASFVLDYRPLKTEPHRVRITVGGDRLTYPHNVGSPAANLMKTKILINSVISEANQGARFMSMYLKDYFLTTPTGGEEYMQVKLQYFPGDIIQR